VSRFIYQTFGNKSEMWIPIARADCCCIRLAKPIRNELAGADDVKSVSATRLTEPWLQPLTDRRSPIIQYPTVEAVDSGEGAEYPLELAGVGVVASGLALVWVSGEVWLLV
jgi:hypothetical protein